MTFFESLLLLLLIAVALLQLARRLASPYPTMLAAAGVVVALVPGTPVISIDPATFVGAADESGKGLADPTVISLLTNTVLPRQHLKSRLFHKTYQLLDDKKQVALQQANRHGGTHSGEDTEAGSVGDGLAAAA